MNIANRLTLLRILLIPVFMIILLVQPFAGEVQLLGTLISYNQLLAGLIFCFASFTDYLDGYLARKYKLVTAFGEFWDPMADKLLVLAAFIAFVELQWVPAWIIIIIISRELLVTGLRVLIARSDGRVLAAALPGKIKTMTQMLSIIFFLFNDIGFSQMNIPAAQILLWLCLIFTVYSGLDYFYHARFVFKDQS